MDLDETNQEILKFIERHTAERGYPPVVRDVAAHVERAPSAVYKRLEKLKEAGLVTWTPGTFRSLRVLRGEDE